MDKMVETASVIVNQALKRTTQCDKRQPQKRHKYVQFYSILFCMQIHTANTHSHVTHTPCGTGRKIYAYFNRIQ